MSQQGGGTARRGTGGAAHDRHASREAGALSVYPIERDAVLARGPDARAFLQGQLSQDIDPLAVGESAWSLLLHPDGKVCAWLRVTREADDVFVLDTDPGAGAPIVERLTRFKLRTKCDLEPVERHWVAVRGADPADAPDGAHRPIVWPGVTGFDVIVDASSVERPGASDEYERLRITVGVPRSGVDIDENTIPAEAGRWLVDASVSFTKGCYTGQELVARIDSRGGNVPRPLRGLRFMEGPGPAGAPIELDGKVVGRVTSAVGDVGLGPVARSVEIGSRVVVEHGPAVVESLPRSWP